MSTQGYTWKFSLEAHAALVQLGYTTDSLIAIDQCQLLVDMINRHVSQGGHFAQDERPSGSSQYVAQTNTVKISKIHLEAADQWQAVTHLAHELGHALSPTRYNYASAQSLALSSSLWEGEALFYEFLAFVQIYPDRAMNKKFSKGCWLDKATGMTVESLYDKFHEIIYGYPPRATPPKEIPVFTDQIKNELAAINREIVNRTIGGKYQVDCDPRKQHSHHEVLDEKNGPVSLACLR